MCVIVYPFYGRTHRQGTCDLSHKRAHESQLEMDRCIAPHSRIRSLPFAIHTWSSASLKTATVRIPIPRAVRITLQAISPLLATSSLSIGGVSLLGSTAFDAEAADILRHAKVCELMACVAPRSLHLANPNMPCGRVAAVACKPAKSCCCCAIYLWAGVTV